MKTRVVGRARLGGWGVGGVVLEGGRVGCWRAESLRAVQTNCTAANINCLAFSFLVSFALVLASQND